MSWYVDSCRTVLRGCRFTLLVFAMIIGLAGLFADSTAAAAGSAPITIDPVPRFPESEVRALIEKPSITFSVDKPRIPSGGSAKLTWRVENADSVTISNVSGSVGMTGSRTVTPDKKTTYTLTATNRNGTVRRSVTVVISTLTITGKIETIKPDTSENLHVVGPLVMRENIHFNFVDTASQATWDGRGRLTFGAVSSTKGWVRVINSVRAEDNKDYPKVLQVVPERKRNGTISGKYTVTIPPKAKFRATVGFTHGHGSADGATVSVQVRGKPVGRSRKLMPWKTILEKTIKPEGKLDTIEADLKAYAGKTMSIRLVVNGRTNPTDDLVLWIAPRIVK